MIIGASLSLDEGDFVVEHLLSSNLGKDQIEAFVAGNNAFIRPIAQYVSEFVGAKWLCIYALPDDKLIGYYGKLGFSRLTLSVKNDS